MNLSDTIVAVSTPPGRGGLGVVRISGSQARAVAASLLRRPPGWQPWKASLAELVDPSGETVDQVVVTFFARPRSYTAEDVVEISCHGAPVLLRLCVERACQAGARLAEPGEFTLRAFLNGRIDLPRAEAVRDLIEATTLYQARVAARQMAGSVSARIAPIKEQLLELIALLEAGIDFAEDDVSVASNQEILQRLDRAADAVARLAGTFAYGKLVQEGFTIAITGRPNVGKSSLFNRLLEQDRAIVTDIPGTTRDLVSEVTSLGGIPLKLVDTAGIREGQDPVESLGIARSYQAMADADITLIVLDGSAPLEAGDQALLDRARRAGAYLVVANKCDLPSAGAMPAEAIRVSARTGEGVDALRDRVLAVLAPGSSGGLEQDFITNIRQERLLQECLAFLEKAKTAVGACLPHEMLLLDLYAALQPIDALTGATTADDILNRIFSTFCIGK